MPTVEPHEIRHWPTGGLADRPSKHKKGLIQHSFGWPFEQFDRRRLVPLSLLTTIWWRSVSVVHLNYDDPYLSPFDEFQRFKTHPAIRPLFEGGKRLAYGARAITEGGYQSVPKLSFAGGALIGCAAGFVNVPRIKGVHNAIGSGMLAAEQVSAALGAGRTNDELVEYENAWRSSAVGKDLYRVRNVKPLWSKFGTIIGVALGGFDMWCNTLGFSLFGTQSHAKPDRKTLDPAKAHAAIAPPKPDGKLTFDRLSSVFLSNTNHEDNQPGPSPRLRIMNFAGRLSGAMTSMPVRPTAIARPASMNGSRRPPGRATSSTPRIASTAKPATPRTPTATLPGFRRRAAADQANYVGDAISDCVRWAPPPATIPPHWKRFQARRGGSEPIWPARPIDSPPRILAVRRQNRHCHKP